MIEGLKAYPAYKASGIPWIGQIPAHWETERARWLFTKMARPIREQDEVVTCFRDGIVTLRKNRRLRGFTESIKEIGYQGIRLGDLVIHAMDAFAGAIGVSDADGKGTPVYSVCQPQASVNPFYYAYALREMSRSQWIVALTKGIRERSTDFRYEGFANQEFPTMSTVEQAAIVRFLDHADRRIRRTIRAKRKLIALLNEQKQVIIHQAVTRGLDPNVRLKPSGVAWLGDIPEHWDHSFLRHCLTRIEQGWSPVAAEGDLAEQQWAVLTLSSVRRGLFDPEAIKPISLDASVPEGLEVKTGDLLLTRSNTRDRVGDTCVVEGVRPKTILSDLIYRLRVNTKRIVSRFLMFQLLAQIGRGQIEKDARGSSGTMPKISQQHIKSWRILLPPKEEQQKIVEHLKSEICSINLTIESAQREITLLLELRTRLISDVVTGKLDVREAAAQLPADEPATESADDTEPILEDDGAPEDAEPEEVEA